MKRPYDHYQMLGVRHNADGDAIRAAYVAQIKTCHPDLAGRPGTFDRYIAVQNAYECLRRSDHRMRYDASLAAERQLRRIRRARRRMDKLNRGNAIGPRHHRAVIAVAAGGLLVLTVWCFVLG